MPAKHRPPYAMVNLGIVVRTHMVLEERNSDLLSSHGYPKTIKPLPNRYGSPVCPCAHSEEYMDLFVAMGSGTLVLSDHTARYPRTTRGHQLFIKCYVKLRIRHRLKRVSHFFFPANPIIANRQAKVNPYIWVSDAFVPPHIPYVM